MNHSAIELESVGVAYGKMRVLREISLSVESGTSMLLLGANGAGKTTLLKAIMGLLPLEEGEITLLGHHANRLSTAKRVKLGIAYMSEQGIFPPLTVDENLKLGGNGLRKNVIKERLDEMYSTFPDLASRRKELAGSLSGGQRKMVGISKCLVAKPSLLLMDEPSAGLSPRYVGEVIAHLQGLRNTGITLLIAEQNVSFLAAADQACVIEGGRINFRGSIDDFEGNAVLHDAFFGLDGLS